MNEERIREEFARVEIPDLKEEILSEVRNCPPKRVRLNKRPVLVAMLLILVLTISVGASAIRGIRLDPGSGILIQEESGLVVQPNGFHTDQVPTVLLSEQALANIDPYVFESSGPATLFETSSRAELEALIGFPLHLPEDFERVADGYRLWATGTKGDPVCIFIQIRANGDWGGDMSMEVYLKGNLPAFITASEPELRGCLLADGSIAPMAVSETTRTGKSIAFSFYTRDGAIYVMTVKGVKKGEVIRQTEEILDTLR